MKQETRSNYLASVQLAIRQKRMHQIKLNNIAKSRELLNKLKKS